MEWSLQREYQVHNKVSGDYEWKQFQESKESVMYGKRQQNILSEMCDQVASQDHPEGYLGNGGYRKVAMFVA